MFSTFIIDENSVLGEFAKMEISSTIGGYVVIRKIGEGGFGTVYLAKSRDGRLHALKEIHNPEKDSHEARSLKLYADALKDLAIEGIVPIEDIFQSGRKLCYAMPLADGTQNTPPEDGNWRPQTLDWVIEQRRKSENWFSKDEILRIFIPIIDAVDALTARGLLHRDVKPANILFFNGKACLADIGLMAEDTPSVSSVGTPDYTPPQWYLQNHGHPDMWGLAATLFTLITGNHPDMMGRAAYFWPPHGKSRMSSDDIAAWEGFHRIIARATREKAKDRYLRIEDLGQDLKRIQSNEQIQECHASIVKKNHAKPLAKAAIIFAAICIMAGLALWIPIKDNGSAKEGTSAQTHSMADYYVTKSETREEVLKHAEGIAIEINALKNESGWKEIIKKFRNLQDILTGILPSMPSVQLGANLYLLSSSMNRDDAVQCYRNAVLAYAKINDTSYATEIANSISYFWQCVNAVSEPKIPPKAGFVVNQSIIEYEKFFDKAVLINSFDQFEDAYESLALALKEYSNSYYRARIAMAKVSRSGELIEEDFKDSDLVYGNKMRNTLLNLSEIAPDFSKWLQDKHPQMVKFISLMKDGKIKIYQYGAKEFNQAEDI